MADGGTDVGVVGAALAVVAGLTVAAVLTGWFETWLLGSVAEPGPAAAVNAKGGARPTYIDRWLYAAAPAVALAGVCSAIVVIPFGAMVIGRDLTVGAFFYLVVVDYSALAIAMGGWAADTPSAVEAGYRAIAQLVAYVIPLGLAMIGPLMMARALSTTAIVEAQHRAGLWYVLVQPAGFALYVATALMQSYRAPFLEPFSARLERGVYGAYGGWSLLIWRLSFAALLFLAAAMGAVLFLGGYTGPILPGPVWMVLKTLVVAALMLWIGRRAGLRSTAETIRLAWTMLIPLGLVNVLVVGALILLGVGQGAFR